VRFSSTSTLICLFVFPLIRPLHPPRSCSWSPLHQILIRVDSPVSISFHYIFTFSGLKRVANSPHPRPRSPPSLPTCGPWPPDRVDASDPLFEVGEILARFIIPTPRCGRLLADERRDWGRGSLFNLANPYCPIARWTALVVARILPESTT
jgi:hypothetical protein